jgi:hypothetical protein
MREHLDVDAVVLTQFLQLATGLADDAPSLALMNHHAEFRLITPTGITFRTVLFIE